MSRQENQAGGVDEWGSSESGPSQAPSSLRGPGGRATPSLALGAVRGWSQGPSMCPGS